MSVLKAKREAVGLSQAELAERVGTSQPQIVRLEKNQRELTGEWALRISEHVGAAPEDLVFGDHTVRIVGYVGAGSVAHYYDEAHLGFAEFPRGGTKETVAVEVRGDSLGPSFNGWIAYYNDRREPPTEDLIGRLCVVWLDDGQVLVKNLGRQREGGRYDLVPNIGSVMFDQVVLYAARVIDLRPPEAKREIESAARPVSLRRLAKAKKTARKRGRA